MVTQHDHALPFPDDADRLDGARVVLDDLRQTAQAWRVHGSANAIGVPAARPAFSGRRQRLGVYCRPKLTHPDTYPACSASGARLSTILL